MRYTDRVNYQPNEIGIDSLRIEADSLWVPTPFPNNPIWRRMLQTFDVENFLYPVVPPDLGRIDLKLDDLAGLRVLRCPIKTPGMRHFLLPTELAAVEPLARHLLETELQANPRFVNQWAHISFESSDFEVGDFQRVPGWHVDGFQGVRVPVHRVEHSYLWAGQQGCEFSIQPYFLSHLDRRRHNIFDELERQARESNAVTAMPCHAYLIDPYVVHRTPRISAKGRRPFIRLTVTETELEDPVNTINRSLGIAQSYPARIDARNRLTPYEGPVPWEMYGLASASSPT